MPTSSRLVSLSSTTSTRSPSRPARFSGTVAGPSGGTAKTAVNEKVEPCPSAALHRDAAAHQLHQVLGDGQAQTGAAELARGGPVHLGEGGEQRPDPVGRDPDAGVPDGEAQGGGRRRPCAPTLTRMPTSPRCVNLTAVARQVEEDLAQAAGVARAAAAAPPAPPGRSAPGPFRAALTASISAASSMRRTQIEFDALQIELPGLDLGVVQDVVDDGEQRLRAGAHQLGVLALLGIQARCPAAARSCRSRRSSACGSRGSCWPGTGSWRCWRPRPATAISFARQMASSSCRLLSSRFSLFFNSSASARRRS